MNRNESLYSLAHAGVVDLAIVGGGATGLGVALDAALRGYSVALLESHDFAGGTSSRSTKLLHGGVRYLAQGNVALVREALHERQSILAMLFAVPWLGCDHWSAPQVKRQRARFRASTPSWCPIRDW